MQCVNARNDSLEKASLKHSFYETQNAGNCRSKKRFDR